MTIIVVGLNYRTAPVALREKLALSGSARLLALSELRGGSSLIEEVVVLSTCNRLEIYADSAQPDEAAAQVEQYLARLQTIPLADLRPHLYVHRGDDAAEHLMRVAGGLDSMILGESQVLGQVTQAFEDAHNAGATGAILSHLFAQAIHTGKRARSETPISRYTTSVSHAGALLLLDQFKQRRDARVLVIGAGEMAGLAAQALQRFDLRDLTFVNRTYARAEALAQEFGGRALDWFQMDEGLAWADAVICATATPHLVIYRRDLEAVLTGRDGRLLTLVDIAVPRDIEASVRDLPGVAYFDIDDLQSVVDANLELRKASVPQVEAIIAHELARFAEWYRGRQVTPVIKDLRDWAQSIADEELIQTLNRLGDADEHTRQIVSRMAHRLVNRLLHEPTSRLRMQAAEGNGYSYASAVRELFALDELETVDPTVAEQQAQL